MVDTKKTNAEIAIEWLKQFNEDQITEIVWGVRSKVDVAQYTRPELNKWQMREIRWRLEREKKGDVE